MPFSKVGGLMGRKSLVDRSSELYLGDPREAFGKETTRCGSGVQGRSKGWK